MQIIFEEGLVVMSSFNWNNNTFSVLSQILFSYRIY